MASVTNAAGKQELELQDLRDIFEGFPDSIFVTDGDGNVIMVNGVSKVMTGTGAEDVLGKNVADLEAQGTFFPSVTRMTLKDGCPHTVLQAVANGKYILVTSSPIKDRHGKITKVVTASRDVSALVDEASEASGPIAEVQRLRAELERAKALTANLRREIMRLKGYEDASLKIVCRSSAMAGVLELATTVADADSTVLITGESGVGKEVLARYIHNAGFRSRQPFVKVCCGAIPESLLESELFGYEPGSFTGARREGKIGLIEAADGGTVFLDEIADLPAGVQVKLLHVLQEKKLTRIGKVAPVPVNVRFIAATNADLEALVERGEFRRDLFYRLNVIPIHIPPLRERADDVPLLALHFLEKLNERYGKRKQLSPEAMALLQEYDWPGNVRELQNLIERLVVTVKEEEITPAHLATHMGRPRREEPPAETEEQVPAVKVSRVVPLKDALEEAERQIIAMALSEGGSMRAAARALKVNVSTISRKVMKLAKRCTSATA